MYRIIPSCPVPSRPALIDSKKGSLNKRKEKRESIKEEEKSKEKNINTELSYTQVYPRPDRVYRVYIHTHTHTSTHTFRGATRVGIRYISLKGGGGVGRGYGPGLRKERGYGCSFISVNFFPRVPLLPFPLPPILSLSFLSPFTYIYI